MPAIATAPKPLAGPVHRRWRNYLLEPRFQLKFTSYIVFSSLVLAVLLGAFLVRTTRVLMHETESALEARERASTADSVSRISTRVVCTRKAPSSTASTSEEITM